MYLECQLIRSHESASDPRRQPLDVDSLIGLISRHPSVHKAGTQ